MNDIPIGVRFSVRSGWGHCSTAASVCECCGGGGGGGGGGDFEMRRFVVQVRTSSFVSLCG